MSVCPWHLNVKVARPATLLWRLDDGSELRLCVQCSIVLLLHHAGEKHSATLWMPVFE